MADESTKFAGKVLEEIHDELKETMDKRLSMYIEDEDSHGYVPPEALGVDKVDDVIKVTNDGMANAARNNTPKEIRGVSRQGNVLLSMARDNYSATATRLRQCNQYALYLMRALHEADDPEDPKQSDGFLITGIRKVEQ